MKRLILFLVIGALLLSACVAIHADEPRRIESRNVPDVLLGPYEPPAELVAPDLNVRMVPEILLPGPYEAQASNEQILFTSDILRGVYFAPSQIKQ